LNLYDISQNFYHHQTFLFNLFEILGKSVKEYEKEDLCFISCHRVEELQKISLDNFGIDVGAAATFTMMEDFFKTSKQSIKGMSHVHTDI
jgi:hypothetical protein